MDRGYSQAGFKRGHFRVAHTTGAYYPAETVLGHLERRRPSEDAGQRRQCGSVEARIGFFVEPVFRRARGAARQTACTLRVRDQLTHAQENVLEARQTRDARLLHYFS